MRKLARDYFAFCFFTLLSLSLSQSAMGQEFSANQLDFHQSVVFLRPIFSGKLAGYGTGFYVDDKQHIITAKHVISRVMEIDGKPIRVLPDEIQVSLGSPYGPYYYVDINSINLSDNNDLAILQSDIVNTIIRPLPLCAKFIPRKGDALRIAGFPNGTRLSEQTGYFDTFSGKIWHIQSKFAHGVSGGPVVNAENVIVGIYLGSYDGSASAATDVILPISELVDSTLSGIDVSLVCPELKDVEFSFTNAQFSVEGKAKLKLIPLPTKKYPHSSLQWDILGRYPNSAVGETLFIGTLKFTQATLRNVGGNSPSVKIGSLYGSFCKSGPQGPTVVMHPPFGPGGIAVDPKYGAAPSVSLDGQEIMLGAIGSSELSASWVCLTPMQLGQNPVVSPPPGTTHSNDAENRGCTKGCR